MTDQELKFIELYRSLDAEGKRAIREFVAFLRQRREARCEAQ